MFRRVYGCGRGCVGAVVGLAALIALAEVGLRIQTLSSPPVAKTSRLPVPTAVASYSTGWQLRPSARVTVRPDAGEPFVFRTNRWGLRGDDLAVPKPAGVFRIVCLGDACLIGPECPEPQTFSSRLQAALQAGTNYPIEVVNAALPLGGPSLALIQAEHVTAMFQPDIVVLAIDAQDIVQNLALRKWIALDRKGQPVSCAPPETMASSKPNMVARLRDEFRLIDWGWNRLSQEWSEDRAETVSRTRRQSELAREELVRSLAPLHELYRRCESRHARLLLVATPARGVFATEAESPANLSDATFFSALGDFLKQTGVTGIDATSVFTSSAEGDHSTWTIDEHRQLAALVAQGMRERLPGPWSSPYLEQNPVTPVGHRVVVPAGRR